MTAAIEDRSMRAKILDVREERRMAQPLEFRTDASGHIVLEGYAATYGQYDVYGGPSAGGWIESVRRDAFDNTLALNPDVQLLVNHEGWPLARTAHGSHPGTLQLQADTHGLLVRAMLDPADPDVQRLMPKMRRGDMDEMSFAFRVRAQDWNSDYTQRTITEVSLQKGDVSVVNYGMNPNTAAMLSTAAVTALSSLSDKDLVEIRNMDRGQVERAMAVLVRAAKPKAYSGVTTFADPGYKDSSGNPAKGDNGVKRYPLNSAARVRAAWSYINMPKNQKGYTASQVSSIKGKIRSAAKKFGIDISESKSIGVDYIDIVRNADGGATLVAVLDDGSRVPLPSQNVPAHQIPMGSAPTPSEIRAVGRSGGGGTAFTGGGYVWNPLSKPADPHDDDYDKEELAMDDEPTGKPEKEPDDDDEQRDYDPLTGDGVVRDTKGEPMESPLDPDTRAADDGDDQEPDNDDDEQKSVDLSLAAALESTIVCCYNLAEGNAELREMLGRARRQVSELRGNAPSDNDVSRKLTELRAASGELPPQTLTVTEGLRALQEIGFADTMHPKAS